ncbi:hypothetical protein V8E54_005223 [Elaphomyces granulatus]
MQFKTLALVFLSAASLAFAALEQKKRQGDIPSSPRPEILTALPASVTAELYSYILDPSAVFSGGSYPAWYQGLPADLKTFVMTALVAGVSDPGVSDSPIRIESDFLAALPTSIISEYQSLPADVKTVIMSALATGVSASGDSAITSATSSILSNTSGSFQVSSNGSSTPPASSASSSGATAAGSSRSHAGAPAATAGIVIGVAGAAGILGMALIL